MQSARRALGEQGKKRPAIPWPLSLAGEANGVVAVQES